MATVTGIELVIAPVIGIVSPIMAVRLRVRECSNPKISTSIAARGGGGSFKRLKLYNSEEHVPIESFGTTLIH